MYFFATPGTGLLHKPGQRENNVCRGVLATPKAKMDETEGEKGDQRIVGIAPRARGTAGRTLKGAATRAGQQAGSALRLLAGLEAREGGLGVGEIRLEV